MCWNAEVSLQSFGIGALGIFFAALTGRSLPFLLFYATIVGMQFVEFVVWQYGESPTVNYRASLVAVTLLMLQPVASLLTLPSSAPLIALYALFGGIYLLIRATVDPSTERYRMTKGPDGHLQWHWLQTDPVTRFGLAIYFIFLLFPLVATRQMDYLLIVLVTLGVSLAGFGANRTWGSMWCWIVNWMVVGVCGLWAWKRLPTL
jgi:drug/metabolite transporter superfamily protein YnfA